MVTLLIGACRKPAAPGVGCSEWGPIRRFREPFCWQFKPRLVGYWEAKDEEDDLDEEIQKKFRKGYPQDNISGGDAWVLEEVAVRG